MKTLSSFLFGFAIMLLFVQPASAQLRMTDPASVVSESTKESNPIVIQDGTSIVRAFSVGLDPLDGNKSKLFMSTYSGGVFGNKELVSAKGGVVGATAVKESGGAVSVVIERMARGSTTNADLYWVRNAGSGWVNEQVITGDYLDRDTQPTLVALANGNLGLVFSRWIAYDSLGNPLVSYDPNDPSTFDHIDFDLYQMNYSASSGTWSAPTPIETTPFISEAYPTLAQGPGGRIYLFYSSSVGGSWSLVWRSYQSGVWSESSILESGIGEQYLQQPSIINDVPGKYRLVYSQKNWCDDCPTSINDYTSEIRYRTYDSITNIWGNPVSVTSRDSFYADQVSAIWSSTGTYWLVFRYWNQSLAAGNTDIYWMNSLANTPVGTNVQVDLGYGSSITFSEVTAEGNSTIDTASTNPGDVSGVLKIGNFFYDINTNAAYTGPMTIRLRYSDQGMTPTQEASLRMLHWLTGSNQWEDATISIDTVNNILTGQVTSLSWIAFASGPLITWLSPLNNADSPYLLKEGSTLPIKFSFKDTSGNLIKDENVKITVRGNASEQVFVMGEGDNDIEYDEEKGVYKLEFHTKRYEFIKEGQTYQVIVSNSYTGEGEGWTSSFQIVDRKEKLESEKKETKEGKITMRIQKKINNFNLHL